MKLKKIQEGEAKIFIPEQSLTRKSEVFYNPEMRYQRDLTIAVLQVYQKYQKKYLTICDPLAGCGVRGIRIAKEVKGIEKIVFNDINPNAFKLIKKNLKLNKIKNVEIEVQNKDANLLFLENRKQFGYIDIDPFGSPIFYLNNSAQALKLKSLFACTATDTACLSGVVPKTCLRRYGIKTTKTDFYKELGIRVLIAVIIREFAKYNLVFEPLLNHSNHYFRVIGRIKKGKVDKEFENIKFVSFCPNCLYRVVKIADKCENCNKKLKLIGPIWTGKIQDRNFCKGILKQIENKELELVINEIDEPFYYDIHKICGKIKINPPKIENLIKKLKNKDFRASSTHFCSTGIKTNAGIREINEILKNEL